MGSIIQAFILGLIEGITEFLPVSSTGHIVLAMRMLGINPDEPPWHAFVYFIQIGAILAVVAWLGRRLWQQIVHMPAGGWQDHLLTKLVVASIPAAAIGLPLNSWVEARLEKPVPVAVALILGAGLMELIERRFRRDRPDEDAGATPREAAAPFPNLNLRQALLIGIAQCASIIPGTSRSMATILGGLMVGLPAAAATEFSFYLAIPTLLGAGLLKLVKHAGQIQADQAGLLVVGFFSAFVSAMIVVQPFINFVKHHRLRAFAIYRVILGAGVLAWAFTRR